LLPGLVLIVGSYVCLRCLEIASKPDTEFRDLRNRIVMLILAVIVFIISAWQTVEVWTAAASNAESFRGLVR
jgi:heme/copper-type cytochrome/quinol oxidase subunit 2